MTERLLISFFVLLFTDFQGCTSNKAPIVLLGTPRFVEQSQPDSPVETGICQDPETGGISLQWYATRGAYGFKVYRSDTTNSAGTPLSFSIVADVISSSPLNDTTAVDVNSLRTGMRFFYYLKAYGEDGSLSPASDTINYTLLNRPSPTYPATNASVRNNGLYFQWYDISGGGYAVVRVDDISTLPHSTIWVTKRFQTYASFPAVYFNFDSSATSQLQVGDAYQWRVERFNIDDTGRSYQGSTSRWSTFTVK